MSKLKDDLARLLDPERNPPEYADAIESFIDSIRNAVQLTKERDQARAQVARVRVVIHEAIADADLGRMGTHWPGCHSVHHDCLAVAVRAALDPPTPNSEEPS